MKTVFLHGLGQTSHSWQEVIRQTLSSDVDCPELFSLIEDGISYPRILTGLEQRYINAPEPFRICGLSLGALLALDYTTRHAEQIASLILIGGQYQAPHLLVALQNLMFRCMPSKAFSGMGLSKRGMLQLTRSMRGLDLTGRLDRITCPVTVVCGEEDRINRRAANRLTTLLAQAELYIIPGAGHEVNRDAPAAIAELLNK